MSNIFKGLEFFKGREIDESVRVFVYFNLHKKVFSVKALEGQHKGKVVLHLPALTLKAVLFSVNQTGRHNVIKTKQKGIHAGLSGYISSIGENKEFKENKSLIEIYYNPYITKTFVIKNEKLDTPIHYSNLIYLENKKIFMN